MPLLRPPLRRHGFVPGGDVAAAGAEELAASGALAAPAGGVHAAAVPADDVLLRCGLWGGAVAGALLL